MTSIRNNAFSSSPIATVTLVNGLTSIGDSWFKQCSSLTTVNIPNSVTSIGSQAFMQSGLTSVDIPSSVTSIGDEAFWNCNIPTVTCWATTAPTLGNDAFSSYPHFYVPSVDAYKDKTNWNDYYGWNLLSPISEKSPAATMPQTTRSITTGVYEGSWTTFYYSGAHMQAPEGVTVYKATVSGNELMLDEISDGIITAGKAVILKKATEGDIVLSVVASGSSDDYEGNALRGVDTETAQSGTNYVLSMVGGNFGFYKLASSKKLSANKAYLPGSSISGAREFIGFGFSEGATKIDHVSVKTNEVDGTVYDLQGRRVSQPTKGLYIVNGKKVVIK